MFSRKPVFGYVGLVAATITHRGAVGRGLGPPHVRHRRGRPAVLLRHDVPDRRTDRGEVLQLDRHDVGGIPVLRHPDAVVGRLPGHLPVRWPDRRHPGQPAPGLPRLRLLLRGRALPLRGVRHRGVRDVRRLLLLVAEDDRPDARRAARQGALLAAVRRLPHDVPGAALAGCRGHAAPLRRLPARPTGSPRSTRSRRSASFLLGASMLPFLLQRLQVRQARPMVGVDDPWGWGRSLEWATSSPPPRHNFTTIPRIRSESPAFDLHHPEVAALELVEANQLGDERDDADAPDDERSRRSPRGADGSPDRRGRGRDR